MIAAIIIALLWGVLSLVTYLPNAPYVNQIEDESDKAWAIGIFLFGGPFFAISSVLEQFLENIMPDDWDGGGDSGGDDWIKRY